MRRYVIVGNGVSGHTAALELRRLSDSAQITMLGLDSDLPYDRPSLTKGYLLGGKNEDEIALKHTRTYDQNRIDHMPGVLVEDVDPVNRQISAEDGIIPYDALLLATGSRPRLLPSNLDAGKGFYLRSLADARRLRAALKPGQRVVVIGGGFIGLEVAAAARSKGCEVTVIENQPSLLSRSMPPIVGAFMRDLHERNGVDIRCAESVVSLDWQLDGSVEIQLTRSTEPFDLVVYGLGIVPNVELAERVGLPVNDGIVVDRQCRTTDSAIFAAGEVTNHPSGPSGKHRRIESWRMASEQPLVAAANMEGGEALYNDPAWLWSDQFDVNLQCLGDVLDGSSYLLRGQLTEGKWTLIALDDAGLPMGAIAVNNGRDISMLRSSIARGAPMAAALTADSRPVSGDPAVGTPAMQEA